MLIFSVEMKLMDNKILSLSLFLSLLNSLELSWVSLKNQLEMTDVQQNEYREKWKK